MSRLIKSYFKKIIISFNKIKLNITTILFIFLLRKNIFAGVNDFKFFSGTQNLLNDLTVWLMGIIPCIGIVLFMYFNARKAGADQNKQQMWEDRRNIAVISCICAELADGLFAWLLSYYQ